MRHVRLGMDYGDVKGACSPQREVIRLLARWMAVAVALFLLQGLVSCRGLDVSATTLEADRLTKRKTFAIDDRADPAMFIWNMRQIPFEGLKPMVANRLLEKGYTLASPYEADLRVVLTTFTEEPSPRTRITIMEIYDRATSQLLWSGRSEIPYELDPRIGVSGQPTLAAMLELVPLQIGYARPHPELVARIDQTLPR